MLKFLQLTIFSLLFVFISLMFQHKNSFYENADYRNFLISSIEDKDFNIINQTDPHYLWLKTKTGYYSAIHSEAQTGFLTITYFYESIFLSLLNKPEPLKYHLGFIFFNLLLLFGIWHFTSEIVSTVFVEKTSILPALFVFWLGTALFYFSVFWVNVFDILSFVIFLFVVSSLLKFQKQKPTYLRLIAISIAIGISAQCKAFNVLLFFPLIFTIYYFKLPQKNLKSFVCCISIGLVYFLEILNRIIKFDQLENPLTITFQHLISFEPTEVLSSIWTSFFSRGGAFTINVFYFLGLIGIFILIKKHKQEILKNRLHMAILITTFVLFFIYSTISTVFIGPLHEDHLPGRFFFNVGPLFLLGFIYVYNLFKTSLAKLVWLSLVLLHQAYMFSYIYIQIQNPDGYPIKNFLSLADLQGLASFLLKELYGRRGDFQFSHLLIVFASTVILSGILFVLQKKKFLQKAIVGTVLAQFLIFSIFTLQNIFYGPANALALEKQLPYSNLSVAAGSEAYMIDYVLDSIKAQYLNSDSEQQNLIKQHLEHYFLELEKQITTQDPKVKQMIKDRSFDLSFWSREY